MTGALIVAYMGNIGRKGMFTVLMLIALGAGIYEELLFRLLIQLREVVA